MLDDDSEDDGPGDEDIDDDRLQELLGYPKRTEEEQVAEEDRRNRERNRHLRAIADRVAAAMAKLPAVERVVLFGSVALPPVMTAPHGRRLRGHGEVTRRCDDLDLAVWVDDLSCLKALQRVRNVAPGEYLRETGHGIANHQIDVFIMEPGTKRYLGRLCEYSKCPHDKIECLVPGCGEPRHLQRHLEFSLERDAPAADRSVVLYEREPAPKPAQTASKGGVAPCLRIPMSY